MMNSKKKEDHVNINKKNIDKQFSEYLKHNEDEAFKFNINLYNNELTDIYKDYIDQKIDKPQQSGGYKNKRYKEIKRLKKIYTKLY